MATRTANSKHIVRRRQTGGRQFGLWALCILLWLSLIPATGFCAWVFQQRTARYFKDRIYPHVIVLGMDLGGLSLAEARTRIEQAAVGTEMTLILGDGANHWTYAQAQTGLHLNIDATLQAAYAVGHSGSLQEQLEIWIFPREIPLYYQADPALVRPLLTALAPEISVPPVDSSFKLEGTGLVVVPGQPGRVLDIEATLTQLQGAPGDPPVVQLPLSFKVISPAQPDSGAMAQAEAMLQRRLELSAYDILTDQTLQWTLDRPVIATWLRLVAPENQGITVTVAPEAVRETLTGLAAGLGDGRGFNLDEATARVTAAFDAGGGSLALYLTHPERQYQVRPGETISSIAAQVGMPSGLIIQANAEIDPNHLQVGQLLRIPSQDQLTPYLPVANKKIVINLTEQKMRVYENGALLHEWLISTGQASSPTLPGHFQILSKQENAYGSQWDLWMPYFMAIYPAGGEVYNGIHELPILSNGQRLWSGSLGRPASFGCIIVGIPNAETLFNWAEIGVPVVIES